MRYAASAFQSRAERNNTMNDVTIFNNPEFGRIRTTEINGEPWFIANDVATVLGYNNPRDALKKHVDDEDRATVAICDGRQIRNVNAINESGLYSLILSSKLPSAKKFKHWVTSEVLPQIRRTGTYFGGNIEDIITKTVTATATAVVTEVMKQIIPLIQTLNNNKAVPEQSAQLTFSAVQTSAAAESDTHIIGVIKKRYKQPCQQKIVNLPDNIRKCVDDMIISGDFSLPQIADYIKLAAGCSVTPPTVYNYKKRYFVMPESGDEVVTYEQITMK